MPTCPFCEADLSEVEFQSGKCPRCGRELSADVPADEQATPEDDPRSTPEPEGADTADSRSIAETYAAAGAGVPAPKDDKSGTADERQVAETLDAGGMPVIPPTEDDRGVSDEERIAQTLQAGPPPMPPPTEGDFVAAGPSDGSRTYDVDGLSSEAAERVSAVWSGSYQPHTSPRTSLKAQVPTIVTESNLIIQPRAIRDTKEDQSVSADYELLGLLGEGGIGVVHTARQASINRTVAVKQLKPAFAADRNKREEFLSEAVVTGDLEHPNIVPIYDLVTSQTGELFYSMKRVKGTPWDTVIGKKPFTENIDNLMRISDAVAFAHSRGVVHRDLKPENVMLGDFGEVLLMDWGLAVSPTNSSGSGMGGTPAYMAPEMATGPVEEVGLHSDVYLLGAILFEIITGKPPHTGKNVMQCLLAAAKNELRQTDKSGELLDIALKAMATAPEDRYVSVGAFQTAIREYQSHSESVSLSTRAEEDLAEARASEDYQAYSRALFGFQEALSLWDGNTRAQSGAAEATLAYASSALRKSDYDLGASLLNAENPDHAELYQQIKAAERERDARQQRLKTAKRVGVALVATILVLVTGAFFWIRAEANRAKVAEGAAKVAEGIAVTQAKVAEEAKKEAVTEAKNARIAENEAKTQAGLARTAEAAAKKAEGLAKVEAENARKAEGVAQKERDDAETARNEAVAAQKLAEEAQAKEEYGAYVARIGLAAAKIDENAFDKAVELLNACPAKLRDWEWGRLMHLCKQDIRTCDARVPLDCCAFSHDGKRFATGAWDGSARIWNAQSGKELLNIPTGGKYVYAVAFSPDDKLLATGDNDNRGFVKIWDSETGKLKQTLQGHRDAVLSVVFSRDGKRLLTSSSDETARLWDLATGQARVFAGHEWWVWSAAFSPDEKSIVTASQDGYAMVWSVETGKAGPPFRGHTGPVFAAAFSPDGRHVATAGYDKRVLIWEPDKVKEFEWGTLMSDKSSPPTEYKALEGHTAGVRSVRFSPNGKLVLSSGNDNTVRVWDAATGRPIKTLRGHAGRVYSCTFSPDGHSVLSGGHDHQAKIWSIEGYEEVRVFRGHVLKGHRDAVLGASFSPDGKQIVSASRDRTAKTWDFDTGRQVREFKEGHGFLVSASTFFPDGKKVLTAAVDNTARIWDVANGTQIMVLQGTGSRAAVALSADAKWILTGGDNRSAKLWNAESGKLVRTLVGHRSEVTAVAISPDGRLLLTGDAKGRCKLWDAESGEEKGQSNRHSDGITAALFLPDGSRVLTASNDKTVGQWDVRTGREELSLILRHPDGVTSMALSPDGSRLVTACRDKIVRSWDVQSGREIGQLASGESSISSVAFAPDGRQILTTGADSAVRLWDLKTRKQVTQGGKPLIDPTADGGVAWSAIFSPAGNYVLTVGGNNARLWAAESGVEHMRFSPQGSVASATFSPDGKQIVTGSWDNAARIWDAKTGRATSKLEGEHTQYVNSAVFSPGGDKVLTASDDDTVKLWDVRTGKMERTLSGHEQRVRSAVFSSDGKRVLTASNDKTARIWDVETGKSLFTLAGHTQAVLCAAFSDDGTRVITAGEDNRAKIWDATTGKEILFQREGYSVSGLEGHTASVTSAAFSRDGKRAITGSQDNTAKIWELRDGKEILTLKGHTQEVTAVAFSPDGLSVLTGSRDGTLIVWLATDPNKDAAPAEPPAGGGEAPLARR